MDARAIADFSAEDFRRRAALESGPFGGDEYGDHRMNPELKHLIVREGLRDAAVLVPVVDHEEGATVILTKRTEALRRHSGQVAFPGGRIDPTDRTPEEAALRETWEEIGLDADHIEIVGRIPDYVTGSGYRIAPVLSIVRPGFELALNPAEVEAAFEVPLAFLMNPANHRRDSRVWENKERFYYTMPFGERLIWGVTAGIIRTLYERLYA
ncbi:MAG TPA: CoA pyrophosphatase [Rhizobiaceae bacterium]|nr:CoA pyrophosphatase [Rhizobiaceae bacterium]